MFIGHFDRILFTNYICMKKFLKLHSMSPCAILFLKEFSFVLEKKKKQVKK